MNLVNFIVWLSAGAVIGWFASRMVKAQNKQAHKTIVNEDRQSSKTEKGE